jgi:hypothetical protein
MTNHPLIIRSAPVLDKEQRLMINNDDDIIARK